MEGGRSGGAQSVVFSVLGEMQNFGKIFVPKESSEKPIFQNLHFQNNLT